MRPQSTRPARHADHLIDVFLHQIVKNNQARRENLANILNSIAIIRHDVFSALPQIPPPQLPAARRCGRESHSWPFRLLGPPFTAGHWQSISNIIPAPFTGLHSDGFSRKRRKGPKPAPDKKPRE